MLVSISFQFVGFLLTYVLHTTHAARLGSRAGLGITLIQYGFALRNQLDGIGGQGDADAWSWRGDSPHPTFGSAAEAEEYYSHGALNTTGYATGDTLTEDQTNSLVAGATTEWLSFFLMTVGMDHHSVVLSYPWDLLVLLSYRMVHTLDLSARLLAR